MVGPELKSDIGLVHRKIPKFSPELKSAIADCSAIGAQKRYMRPRVGPMSALSVMDAFWVFWGPNFTFLLATNFNILP